MNESIEVKKTDLELRELELKVRELELKVTDLERPSYKKISFWTSIITVCIAIIGIIGQSFLSNVKNAQAKLETELAKKEMQEALQKKATVLSEIKKAGDSVIVLQRRRDTLQQDLNKMIFAYNKVLNQEAYSNNDPVNTAENMAKTKTVITETSNNISNVLLNNASDLLLKSSVLKVYYSSSTKEKATTINSLLTAHGVQSAIEIPDYDISKARNEIVYYNEPQLNYCKAVQALLQQSGQGLFSIRLSSGASATIHHFKIYVSR